jgi:hypothetical protein
MTLPKHRRLLTWIALALTLAAVAAPTAAADDWWAYTGPATTTAVRPDDRPGPRGPGTAPQRTYVRPDDRPGPRGPGAAVDTGLQTDSVG